MLVKDCMTRHPIMINDSAKAAEVQQIMTENKIRHVPVVDDGKILTGLITRTQLAIKPEVLGSLNVWEISRRLSGVTVKQTMLPRDQVHTITADRTVERAAKTMAEHKIGCLPVIDKDGAVVGLLSEVDLLRAFQQMLGLPSEGVRVTVRMPNQSGEFAKLGRALAEKGWGVMGIGTFPSPRRENKYDAILKIPGVTIDEARAVLENIEGQELIDIRDVV